MPKRQTARALQALSTIVAAVTSLLAAPQMSARAAEPWNVDRTIQEARQQLGHGNLLVAAQMAQGVFRRLSPRDQCGSDKVHSEPRSQLQTLAHDANVATLRAIRAPRDNEDPVVRSIRTGLQVAFWHHHVWLPGDALEGFWRPIERAAYEREFVPRMAQGREAVENTNDGAQRLLPLQNRATDAQKGADFKAVMDPLYHRLDWTLKAFRALSPEHPDVVERIVPAEMLPALESTRSALANALDSVGR